MTDHEHTPTTEVIRETYIGEPPYALYGYTEEEFDRWLSTVEAAAEQRGKEQGWDEVATWFESEHGSPELADDVEDANPHRTDQMEGDE